MTSHIRSLWPPWRTLFGSKYGGEHEVDEEMEPPGYPRRKRKGKGLVGRITYKARELVRGRVKEYNVDGNARTPPNGRVIDIRRSESDQSSVRETRRFGLIWSVSRTTKRSGYLIEYHHIFIAILTIKIIILCLLLAACTGSNALIALYLLSLAPSSAPGSTTSSSLTDVRVGYFGICISRNGSKDFFCASNRNGILALLPSGDDLTRELLGLADYIKDQVVLPYLIIIALAISSCGLIIAIVPGWTQWVNQESTNLYSRARAKAVIFRPNLHAVMYLILLSSMLLLTAAVWQHVGIATASSVLDRVSSSSSSSSSTSNSVGIQSQLGVGAMAIMWAACGISFLLFLMLLMVSIIVIKYTDSGFVKVIS